MFVPVTKKYVNITVVRDDMLLGGTKSRFTDSLFVGVDELVYASPAQGGAQTALAVSAKKLGKKLTLFVAESKNKHPRIILSEKLGAKIIEVKMGFLTNVQAKARNYVHQKKLLQKCRIGNLEFGLGSPRIINLIAETAKQIPTPKEIWCAAGSGTLARGLALAWPDVPRYVVQVGHKLTNREAAGATVIVYPRLYSYQEKKLPPFPSDPTYERKAWRVLLETVGDREATFWNTAGAAEDDFDKARIEFQGESCFT